MTACIGLLLVLFGLVAWAAVDLLRVHHEVNVGKSDLLGLSLVSANRPGGVAAAADSANRHIVRADGIARHGLPLRLAAHVPLLSGQVHAVQGLTGVAVQLGVIGGNAAHTIQPQLDAGAGTGSARLELLDTAITVERRARASLDGVTVGAKGPLVPPLASARRSAQRELARLDGRLADADHLAGQARQLLGGPGTYLVLAANNAEIRAGGVTASAGLAEISNGDVQIGAFKHSEAYTVPTPVPMPADIEALWGWEQSGRDFRPLSSSPNFPEVAPVDAAIAEKAGLGHVDGVIEVDAIALAGVLAVTGPIDVAGVHIDYTNAAQQILNEDYLRFPVDDVRSQRGDLQSQVAVAAFDALRTRHVSLAGLARVLLAEAKGRHLLGWSQDPAQNGLWQRMGADGALQPDGLMLNLNNRSADKTDWYINPSANLKTVKKGHGWRRLRLTVTVPNPHRDPTSDVIDGVAYAKAAHLTLNDHIVLLALYLPRDVFAVGSADPPFSRSGTDGPMKVAMLQFAVPEGQTRTVTVDFSLPDADKSIYLMPSARAHPIVVRSGNRTYTDAVPVRIPL